MKKRGVFVLFLLLVPFIAGAETVDIQYKRGDLKKMISVVKTEKPPVIDGVLEEGEWDKATVITGLIKTKENIQQWGVSTGVDNIAGDQSFFYITYDDENLYIAHHSPPPARLGGVPAVVAVMLKKTQTIHDANINLDDSIHIEIIDPVYPGGDKYVIQINSTGTAFECIWYNNYVWEEDILAEKSGRFPGITLSWDPPVRSASNLTLDGWVIETEIHWSGLVPYIKKPEDGRLMYMNFGRIWKEVMDEGHIWAADDEMSPAGEVVFTGKEGIIVQIKDTGDIPKGVVSFTADIINAFASEKKLLVDVQTEPGGILDKKDITLSPGEKRNYTFRGRLKDVVKGKIVFMIKDREIGSPVHITTLPVIRPTEPDIYVRRYRSIDMMKFEMDISFLGDVDLKRTAIAIDIKNKKTGKKVYSRTFRGFQSYQPAIEVSTKNWEPGEYTAHIVFLPPGKPAYRTDVNYLHPELPEWWNNRYGFEDMERDRVPYPWVPVELKDDTVGVWGRRYIFEKGMFPKQITTLDYPLLRAPVRLIVKTAGGEVIDTSAVNTKAEWTSVKRTRVEATRLIEGEEISLKNNLWIEYDGLLWNTLKINPAKKTVITSMELEVPLTKEFTDVINPRDYSMRTTGKLRPEGFSCEPTRAVWLGNGDGGIQWFCETDGWFFVKDVNSSLKVEVRDGVATLRIVMIDMPTEFDSPHEIQFGLMATPVRPKVWRTPEHMSYRGYPAGRGMFWDVNNEVIPGALNDFSGLYVGTAATNPSQEAFKLYADEWRPDAKSRSSEKTGKWVPVTMASKSLRDYYAWRHWYRQHLHTRGFSGLYYDCSGACPSANPYAGTGYKRRDGSMATTYPYLAEREITKRLYNITLSNNEFASRDAWIGYHHSGMPIVMYMSFANESWDGENLNSRINQSQQTYLGVIDTSVYRAEFMGHNFGWPVFFLGQGRIKREWVEANGGPEAVFDQISGLDLLHDGGGVCCIMPAIGGAKTGELRRVRERMTRALDKYNFYHWIYQYIPYWRQDIVKVPRENMYVSIYLAQPSKLTATDTRAAVITSYFDKHLTPWIKSRNNHEVKLSREQLKGMEDRAILIVYNESDYEGEVRLKVDWGKLGLGGADTLKVENAVHSTGFRLEKRKDEKGQEYEEAVFFPRPEEYARIEGDEVVFPITRYNYRMIVIEKKK